MVFDKKNLRMILVIAVIVLGFYLYSNPVPKQAVVDIEGQPCTTDGDCPCWGELASGTAAYGLGVGRCKEAACDMALCYDVEPVGNWLRDNPLAWLTNPDNALVVALFIGLGLLVIFWPKV